MIEQASNPEANCVHELGEMSHRVLTSAQGQLFELRRKAEGRDTMGSKTVERKRSLRSASARASVSSSAKDTRANESVSYAIPQVKRGGHNGE